VKYFFLSDGWTVGRVWELGGLWDESSWRRKPHILRMNLRIWEGGQKMWLYQVEEAVIMVEVKPEIASAQNAHIGKVMLKRLISAEQALNHMHKVMSDPENNPDNAKENVNF
jgi:hypothetical protein